MATASPACLEGSASEPPEVLGNLALGEPDQPAESGT